jgi:hypothetical protein
VPAPIRRGDMKRQLLRASIVAMRGVNPRLHFCHIDPVINVLPERLALARETPTYHLSRFEACDMIPGRREPDLGGQGDLVLVSSSIPVSAMKSGLP